MKKTERRLVKVQGIEFLKNRVAGDLERLEDNFKDRHKTNAIKLQMKKLHQDLFLLRAAGKQIPMPVKIKTSLEGKFSGWWEANGTYHVSVHYNAYCQNCGRKVERGVKGMGAGFEHNEDEQYCQYCGQKLWWPKN